MEPDRLRPYHATIVEGHAIEGDVPAADIKRPFAERTKATGIAVLAWLSVRPAWSRAIILIRIRRFSLIEPVTPGSSRATTNSNAWLQSYPQSSWSLVARPKT